ncbi:Cytochrome p450 [Thalictrum thalictroides]|uniref:Cytochrome p450 n=1 Tax=Thalictrum thalictroides TaxID=46969 RepID=A0A7J6V3P2_THATH|nr:Cytochrome p450 [Thalictrum thalictroides]
MDLYTSLYLSPLLLLFISILLLKKRNNQPPSPPKLPIIGNLHQLGTLPHRSLQKLSNKYGPIMLMQFGSKPTLIISSADTAREVLKTQDHNFCTRPSLVGPKRLSYNFRDFAFTPYGEYWREMRRICVLELFCSKRVQSFDLVREEEVANLMKSISEFSSSPLNLTQKLFSLTDRITNRITFGKNNQGKDYDIGKLQEIVYEAMDMLGSFTATDFFPYFGWIIDVFTGFNKRLEKCFTAFDNLYQQVIDEHLDPERKKPEQEDIIDVLLGLQRDESGGTRITVSHIKGILMNIFLGGIDTSAMTMVWAMTELLRKPEAMKKVQEEIRTFVGKKGKVEASDLNHLQYLKMVVKETLRLHAPAILLIPRECMKQCKIHGYDIYPKTRVLVNVWAIGRSGEYWENPEDFIPDRFIDKDIDFRGQDFDFLPFGSGRRGCPGINMGITAVELGLANLLYCFNWELPNGMKKEDIDMDETAGITVHKKTPLVAVPTKYVHSDM